MQSEERGRVHARAAVRWAYADADFDGGAIRAQRAFARLGRAPRARARRQMLRKISRNVSAHAARVVAHQVVARFANDGGRRCTTCSSRNVVGITP